MTDNEPPEMNTSSSAPDRPAVIDLQKLAEKIVELLKREARTERERTGQH